MSSSGRFWDFSLAVYSRAGVADACLALQDECDLDVNVLLFALYAGVDGVALDVRAYEALDEVITPWREKAVRPLRAARREVRRMMETLHTDVRGSARKAYESIKAAELATERAQQLSMEEWLSTQSGIGLASSAVATSPDGRCAGNLLRYLEFRRCAANETVAARLQILRNAALALPSRA